MLKQIDCKYCLWTLLCACVLITSPVVSASEKSVTASEKVVIAQSVCGADQRAAFLEAANDDVPADQLVELFSHCTANGGEALVEPEEKVAIDGGEALAGPVEKIITINNGLASVFYEQMNGCGYHPQLGVAVCDVEIKQTFGFGPFGPAPLGSTEFVDFCFFCGGAFILVPGTVHVTDDTTGVLPSWGMMAFGVVPPACGMPAGTGAPLPIRATLSWGVPAIAPCTPAPTMVWGNQINFDTRDDP